MHSITQQNEIVIWLYKHRCPEAIKGTKGVWVFFTGLTDMTEYVCETQIQGPAPGLGQPVVSI